MNSFNECLLDFFSSSNLKKINNTNIFVCGAGGIGSNTCHNLTRCGFINFTIVDFDKVSHSNLNRQFYFENQVGLNKVDALKQNLEMINHEINVKTINKKIVPSDVVCLVKDFDIIIEALDNKEIKSKFIKEAILTKKPVISVSGIGGYSNSSQIGYKKLGDNLYIVGDFKNDVNMFPPLSPHVNLASSIQADIVLSIVLDHTIEKGDNFGQIL